MVVNSGAKPNTVVTYATAVNRVNLNTNSLSVTAYPNQHSGATEVTRPIRKNKPINGFRKPSGYRRFDSKIIPVSFGPYSTEPVPPVSGAQYGYSGSLTPCFLSVGFSSPLPYHGTKVLASAHYPDTPLNLINRVNTQVLNKLVDGSFNMAVSIAESRQTFDLIANSLLNLQRAYKAFKSKNYNGVRQNLGLSTTTGASDNWLSYQYGWLPLLSDIHGATELLLRRANQHDFVTAYSRSTQEMADQPGYADISHKEVKFIGECRFGVEVKIWASMSDSKLAILNGLGLTNPLLVAWEKLPWSFVLDWLLPVGAVISAFSSTMGLTFRTGYMTEKSWVKGSLLWYHIPSGYKLKNAGPKCQIHLSNQCMYRTELTTFPNPGLFIKSPFSTTHVANALALLTSTVRAR